MWTQRLATAAICPSGHRWLIPFRLLKTGPDDRTPLYGRPFRCKACGSREVALFSIESQAELDEVQRALAGPPQARSLSSIGHPQRCDQQFSGIR
jgi:hypothetical protein